VPVGRVDGRIGAEDDLTHQASQGGEGQLAGVLGVGVSLEDLVERGVADGPGDGGPDHHGDRGLIEEALQDLVHNHVLASWVCGNPIVARHWTRHESTLKGVGSRPLAPVRLPPGAFEADSKTRLAGAALSAMSLSPTLLSSDRWPPRPRCS